MLKTVERHTDVRKIKILRTSGEEKPRKSNTVRNIYRFLQPFGCMPLSVVQLDFFPPLWYTLIRNSERTDNLEG